MTKQEVMAHLKCSESAIYKMVNLKRLEKNGNDYGEESVNKLTGGAKNVYTVQEAAELLGVSTKTVILRATKGELKSFRVGSGEGNSGLRIADIKVNAEPKVKVKPKKKAEKPKQEKSKKIVIKKIQAGDAEIYILVQGDQELAETKLIRDYVKAWIDGSTLEENLAKLRELL